MGTKRSQALILKRLDNSSDRIWISPDNNPLSNPKPINVKTIRVIITAGPLVNAMYLIWLANSAPAIAGAKLVVSEIGDILSPK